MNQIIIDIVISIYNALVGLRYTMFNNSHFHCYLQKEVETE